MRIASLLCLLAFAGCADEDGALEPWPIPVVGLDGGIDASARDTAVAADAARDARTR